MWHTVVLMIFGAIANQTDWMGGPGVFGPVSNWGTRYFASDSVTVAVTGQVSLVATSWDYANWSEILLPASSGVWHHTQGLFPADIDNDGILDIVGHDSSEVCWWKHDGDYGFSKNVIGAASDGGITSPCTYPVDLDSDGKIDVLYATAGAGVGWFKNNLPSGWLGPYTITSGAYHRVAAADIDKDGDVDVLAVDNSDYAYCGTIKIWKNDGSENFGSPTQTFDLVSSSSETNQSWRVYFDDFNNDGYPDFYSSLYDMFVYLNDGPANPGHFSLGWHQDYWYSADWDGAWPSDIDMDGDRDIICAKYQGDYHFHALLNNGSGTSFADQDLGVGSQDYADGVMVRDMDLDGILDIVGTCGKVGWFRQDSPMSFSLHWIDDLAGINYSHWIYTTSLCNKCSPSGDLLVTEWNVAHKVYRNQMVQAFASIGELQSSIIQIEDPAYEPCTLKYFCYNACVPNDTSLAFYWRAGLDSTDIDTSDWNGPYPATVGMNVVDSFSLALAKGRMFQYKVEVKGDADIAVLYEIWLNYDPAYGIEEPVGARLPCPYMRAGMDGKLMLELPFKDYVQLEIYDVAGRRVSLLFAGYLPYGTYEFELPINRSGVYFARLCSTKGSQTLKFIRLK